MVIGSSPDWVSNKKFNHRNNNFSPVPATVGLSLNIPAAIGADILRQKTTITVPYAFGALFVALGFLGVNIPPYLDDYLKKIWEMFRKKKEITKEESPLNSEQEKNSESIVG
jgi:hypothetical protein